jgi:hypothetical protein
MDFTSRPNTASGTKDSRSLKDMRIITVVMLLLAAVLLLSIAALFAFVQGKNESSYIDNKKLQAVFLDNGETYFGRIRSLNENYMRIDSVFYSLYGGQVQPDEHPDQEGISVFKLGCERHNPTDQMVINRDRVRYWENLHDDSPVVTAIAKYIKDNPKECAPVSLNSSEPTTTP